MAWPTPIWSIGAVGIYITEHELNQDPVRGEVHVLDALNSTKHYSGSMGKKGFISGILVTTGCNGPELTTLQGYAESDTSRTLTGDMGGLGDWKVGSIQAKRKQALNVAHPVYEVRIELSEA